MKTPCSLVIITMVMQGLLELPSCGATVTLTPSMDTSVMETVPDNNTGAMLNLISGSVANGKRSRCLMRFDLSGLPPGSEIGTVSLTLTVMKAPPHPVAPGSTFGLHRVLVDWVEGDKGPGNTGGRATDGEPTWNMLAFGLIDWTEVGGAITDTDYSATISGSRLIDQEGTYTIEGTPEMTADVQSWLCHPDSNFGWVLISNLEDQAATSRRFFSKESGSAQAPALTVEYGPAAREIRISDIRLAGDSVVLRWSGGQPGYRVQRRSQVDGDWADVGEVVGCDRSARIALQETVGFLRVVAVDPQ